MFVRLWRTSVRANRIEEYRRFANEVSLPMFSQQQGFRGVLFAENHEECLVITFWDNAEAIAALTSSPMYRATVARIQAAGYLVGESQTEVFERHGGTPIAT